MPNDPVPPATAEIGRSRSEKLFLGGLISFTLLAAIVFLALTAKSIFVPPMGIALLFGIVVATLAYAFLGAKGDDKFSVRAFQVAGAAAVVIAIVWVSNSALERQFDLAERLDDASKRAQRQLVIDQDMTPVEIVGGGRIDLVTMNSLNGWDESGGHRENVSHENAATIFTGLFRKLEINRNVEDVLKMSDEQWGQFLAALPERKRLAIGGIPFAKIQVRSSDGRETSHIVFKNDQIPVLKKSGEPEACLTIERVLDVRERQSGEPEVLVVSQKEGGC